MITALVFLWILPAAFSLIVCLLYAEKMTPEMALVLAFPGVSALFTFIYLTKFVRRIARGVKLI